MNKIFKVIWNHATQSWVAVSELQKAKGKVKSSYSNRIVLTSLVSSSALLLAVTDAVAAVAISQITSNSGTYNAAYAAQYDAIAVGVGAQSTGHSTIAIGTGANATHRTNLTDLEGNYIVNSNGVETGNILVPSIAIGMDAVASSSNAIALGTLTKATGNRATAFGAGAEANGNRSTVMGWSSMANGTRSFAMGSGSRANADYSGAMGDKSAANGTSSLALGASAATTVAAVSSLAIGNNANASNTKAAAIGFNSRASGEQAISFGVEAVSSNQSSVAIGESTKASGVNSYALGTRANATALASYAIGEAATANNSKAIAIGSASVSSGDKSIAIGDAAQATNTHSFAMGGQSVSTGLNAVALGSNTNSSGNYAVAIGNAAKSSGAQSFAAGTEANASANYSSAVGPQANASAANSFAGGYLASASADNAVALGKSANATKASTVAIGNEASVSEVNSVAIGYKANSTAQNAASLGREANSTANYALALGANSQATLERSVAIGSYSTVSAAVPTNTATVGGITYSGFAGNNPAAGDIVSVGSNDRKRQIQNVAAGQISATSTDAINGSQLYMAMNATANLANSTKNILGSNATLNPNGSITFTNIGDTNKNTVHEAIKAVKTEVVAGSNVNVTSSTGTNGQPIYTVNAYNTTASSVSPNYITVTGKAATAANTTNYEIGLTQDAITKFTKDTQATVISKDGTVKVDNTGRNENGTVIYDLSVNIPAQASQIQYFSVNSTVPENQVNDGAKSRNSIAIGPNATATGGEQAAIALGTNSNANGNGALSLGVATVSNGIQATAVGHLANATANGTTALGRQTNATAGDATAVGSNANATAEKASAFGVAANASANASLAVGANSIASAQSAVAVGTRANATAQFATALGMGAQATLNSSVALGSESVVSAARPTENATVGGITYNGFAGVNKDTNYVVSVGSAGKERQIQNVAAGQISATSTDAINGSQLYMAMNATSNLANSTANNFGGGSVVNPDGSVTQPQYNVTNADKTQYGNTATNVGDAITNLNNYVNQGFNIKDNAGETKGTVTPNESVQFVNGKGTVSNVTQEADGVTKVTFDVDTGSITVDNTTGAVTTPTDENKVATTKTVADAIKNSGFTATSSQSAGEVSGTSAELVNPGDTVTFDAGKNIKITQAGSNFTFATKDTVEFDKVTTKTLEIPTDTANKPITITKDGINTAGKQIKDVADGVDGKDAVNVDQLKAAKWTLQTSQDNVAADKVGDINADDKVTIDGKGVIKVTNTKEANNESKVHIALETQAIKVENGQATTDGNSKTGDTVNTAPNTNAIATVGDVINAVNNVSWSIYQGADKVNDVKAGNEVHFVDSDQFTASATKDGDTKTNVTFTAKTVSLTDADNNGKVDAPQTEADKKKLVNAGDIANAINNSGFKAKANGDDGELINPGDEVNFKDGENIKVTRDGSNFTIATAKDVTFNNVTSNTISVPTGTAPNDKPITITKDGIDVAGKPITNVASNLPVTNSTGDATNTVSQAKPNNVNDVKNNAATVDDVLNAGWNLQENGDAKDFVKTYDTVNFVDGKGTKANVTMNSGNSVANVTFNIDAGTVIVDDKGKVTTPAEEDKVATTKTVAEAIQKAGWNAKSGGNKADGDQDAAELINPGEEVIFAAGDNLIVKRVGNQFTFATAKDVQFDSVTFGDNGPKITNQDGNLNIAGNDGNPTKITGVKAGEADTDAVNVSQLNQKTAAAKTEVRGSGLATVGAPETGDSGQTIYTVDVAKAEAPTVTRGNVSVAEGDKNKVMTAGDVADAINNSEKTSSVVAGSKAVTVKAGQEDDKGNTEYTVDVATDKSISRDDAGNMTVNTDNVTIVKDPTTGEVKANTTTLNNTPEGKVTDPTGDDAKKLVTAGDIANAINNSGFNVTAGDGVDGGETNGKKIQLIKPSETITFDAGKNMTLTQADGKFTYTTKDNVAFNSIDMSNGKPDTTGSITNLKSGVDGTFADKAAPTDAERKAISDKINNATGDTLNNAVNVGDVQSAMKAATTKVDGTEGVEVSSKTNDDGSTTYTVKAKTDGTTIKLNDKGEITANTSELTNNPDGKVVEPAAPNALVTAKTVADAINNAGFNIQANGDKASLVKTGDTVQFLDGKNIEITRDGNNITVATAKDVNFNSVQFGNEGPKITNNGGNINVGDKDGNAVKVTNVANGDVNADSKDAVNGSQLYTFAMASREEVKSDDKSVTINTTKNTDGANVFDLSVNTDDVTIVKDPTTGAIKANTTALNDVGNDGKIDEPTADNAKKLVTAGDIVNAINSSGFMLKTSAVEGGEKLSGDNELINPGKAVEMIAGKNLTVKQEADGKVTYATKDDVKFDSVTSNSVTVPTDEANPANNPITINKDGIDAGNKAISNVASNLAPVTPMNEKQPSDNSPENLANKLNNAATVADVLNAGWNLQGNSKAVDTVTHNDTVDFVDGKGTKVTVENKDGKNTIKVDSPIEFVNQDPADSSTPSSTAKFTGEAPVQLGNVASGVRKPDGTTPEGKERAEALNNASGDTVNNAVNVGDLQAATKAATTKVDGNQGVVITPTTNGDGSTTYTVAAKTDGTTIKVNNEGNITANTSELGNNADGTVKAPTQPNALVTAQTVADAVNNAGFNIKSAGNKANGDQAATKLVKTGEEVVFEAGDNLTVKRDGNQFTFATAKDVSFNSVQFSENGPKITNDGDNIKVGDKDGKPTKITNVADGDISPVSTDVINGKQLNNYAKVNGNNIGTDEDGSINIVNGNGTTITSDKAGEVKVNVNSTDLTVADNGTINVQDPNGTGSHFVNATTVANAVNNVSWNVDSKAVGTGVVEGDKAPAKVKAGSTVSINAGNNIKVTRKGSDVTVAVSDTPEFTSVKTGDTLVNNNGVTINNGSAGKAVSLTKDGLNNGGNRITNVKAGEADTDAVNVGQLKGVANQLNNKINRNSREARAGIAGSNAAASLPQVYIPGKSMVAAAGGTFKGENALAVGYSRSSDNGKLILKLQGNANSRGDFGGGVGVGYQW
ncbi:YadA-like family protein [Mannheimia varigena]|uniref:YadA-like family protein n=1 Tax=Mannheimia varigena TaxID=85404 RepID=UPI001F206784|nr:YadA-like family protein [Mannheimia varigena]